MAAWHISSQTTTMKFISSIGIREAWTQQGMSSALSPSGVSRKAAIDAATLGFVNRPRSLVFTLPQLSRPKSKQILRRDNGHDSCNFNASFI